MSSVRLDNFVYTAEAFGEMRQHLTPNGVLSVTFTVHERWIADRLYSLFEHTFGTRPLVFQGAKSSSSGTVFLGGRPVENLKPRYLSFSPTDARDEAGQTWRYEPGTEGYLSPSALQISSSIPTDDWPYLYLRDRGVPANYLLCIAGLFALSFLTIRSTTGLDRVRWPFFFLGAAFLLVETKAMTELAIFLGSTWTVNFFVITAVLGLIVAGTLLVLMDRAPSTSLTFIVLASVLAVTYASPLEALLGWDSPLRNWVVVLILCLPLFFAAIIFARIIRHESQPSVALGSNLLGALAGGLLRILVHGVRTSLAVSVGDRLVRDCLVHSSPSECEICLRCVPDPSKRGRSPVSDPLTTKSGRSGSGRS